MSALSHITFVVHDIERMSLILTHVLKAQCVYRGADERFFQVDDVWIAILKGPSLPVPSYNHVAFKVEKAELEERRQAVMALGLKILPSRARTATEGQSVYFYDNDNHLFELHTGTLVERLQGIQQKQ